MPNCYRGVGWGTSSSNLCCYGGPCSSVRPNEYFILPLPDSAARLGHSLSEDNGRTVLDRRMIPFLDAAVQWLL
jgi:hypothetical protein